MRKKRRDHRMAIVKRGDRGLKPGVIYALSGILFMVLEFNEKEKLAYRYINMCDKNELATPKRPKRSKFISLAAACYRVVVLFDFLAYCQPRNPGKREKKGTEKINK